MKISVIIPVYNAERYLHRCLNSILSQTYNEWEVIAIDDGSLDNSFSILNEFSLRDNRIIVLSHTNRGPGLTRNKAIDLATGDYIVFIDSDDYVETSYFKDLVICASRYNSDVIFIDAIQESPDGKVIKHEIMSRYKDSSKDTIIRHQMTGKLPWGGWRKAVKAPIIIENNIRYSKDNVGEEALFSFRVLMEAKVISFLEKPYYHYINYPNSQSKKGDYDPWGDVCKTVKNYLQEHNLLEQYEKTINSFAYTALIVSVNRISIINNFRQSIKLSNEALNEFKNKYSFDLELDSLEWRTRAIVPFIKHSNLIPIIIISKIIKFMIG